MAKYISQKAAADDRAKLKAAQIKLKVALKVLDEIGNCYCCETCMPDDPHCPVGMAKDALHHIKEIKA